MPTTRTWYGRDPGNEGDWQTAENWLPNGVPVSGDTCNFTGGSQPVSAGLFNAGVVLAGLNVRESYNGSIGAPGAPLVIGATSLILKGSGREYHIQPLLVATCSIDLPHSNSVCYFGGPLGSAEYLHLAGGRIVIQPGYPANQIIQITDASFNGPPPHVTFTEGVDFAGPYNSGHRLLIDGGVVVVNCAVDSGSDDAMIELSGGTLILNAAAEFITVTGGTLRHNDGDVDRLIMRGGVYDAGVSTTPRAIGELSASNDATLILRTDVGAVAVAFTRILGNPNITNEES